LLITMQSKEESKRGEDYSVAMRPKRGNLKNVSAPLPLLSNYYTLAITAMKPK